jgi:outer membrane protein assembly factor BamB
MKVNKKYLIVIIFLLVESASAYFVFNYSTRTRKPIEIYEIEDGITSLGISSSGNSLAIGGEHGEISFFEKGKTSPRWVYHGNSEILSVDLSAKGEYITSIDGNHNINLFSDSPYKVGDEVRPRWTFDLKQGAVAGVHSSGGMPPLVFILVTSGGRIGLLSNRDGVVWEYQTGASNVIADMSSNGRRIVAVDSQGNAIYFNINSAEPLWKASTDLTEVSFSLSQDTTMAVGGKSTDGGGRVYVLSLNDGELIWEWHSEKPINSVSISSSGDQVIAHQEEGAAYVLRHAGGDVEENIIDVPGGVRFLQSPPFGSYVIALNPDGQLYFLYTRRDTPLWSYDTSFESPMVAITSTGENIFVATSHEVAVIHNAFQTGFIPGSRWLWGVVFFTGLFGAIGIGYVIIGMPGWLDIFSIKQKGILYGFLFGAILGYYLEGGFMAIVGGVGCAMGVLYGWKSEDLLDLVMGFFASLIVSLVAGYFLGLIQWFSGYEANIITLTVVNTSRGGRLGIILAILGVSFGKVSS